MKKNFLITSPPGTGKTTAIKKFIDLTGGKFKVSGFITEEIRDQKGKRVGFKITTLDGKTGILADINLKNSPKVGKYGVNLKDIDNIAVPSINLNSDIIVIDEIGKMECFSKSFVQRVFEVLDSEKILVGTIKEKGDEIINKIKSRNDVELIKLTLENRDEIPFLIFQKVASLLDKVYPPHGEKTKSSN
ncbi:nucleoside-triphosphatase [Candidatus Kryptonium thompsonii]|uniref:Nucleoside-triphosphatase n=1 Tax=Candidatus Kryptonium thompsonii TaxID=1633631 RepID=A0A0P1LTS5_9BACT|nr:NTPase [Candidatus Kryptonium thompsoni]CUS77156.1 nucleoside-triphosphatase [Candidatus Kryptonium thompsoni]CUS79577.1 nucleoside-triphosphatase [Candidatus Kryptonium thompsoni]CUS81172.1 nucleoside-triphosphatase [Candidatus Kryptonium thompsoni]CUS82909.1 nucleoside-triphosphatase [Candidatus Kryptonium thompsoni]CUS85344.1 nucleoside-triphosphatase [Candidatus Kryptonium thompsoni]